MACEVERGVKILQCITPPRNDEALIGQKLNRPTFEVDDELSTQHEEELIVVVVFMPVVFALHHAKAHTESFTLQSVWLYHWSVTALTRGRNISYTAGS
jgi:hypothetical protein